MSAWDSYIKSMTDNGLQISGLYGQEGGQWAASTNMKSSQQEIYACVQSIKSQNFANGIVINGKKCTLINSSPDSLTAKCRNADSDDEKYLFHVALGKKCVVIGGMCGGNEREAISKTESIRDYLMTSDY